MPCCVSNVAYAVLCMQRGVCRAAQTRGKKELTESDLKVALGKEYIVRRQFMWGTGPLKSKRECLKIICYRRSRAELREFSSAITLFVILCSFTIFNLIKFSLSTLVVDRDGYLGTIFTIVGVAVEKK